MIFDFPDSILAIAASAVPRNTFATIEELREAIRAPAFPMRYFIVFI